MRDGSATRIVVLMNTTQTRRTRRPSAAQKAAAENTTESMLGWLANHRECVAAGVNVGQLARDKAQRVSVELIRRNAFPY